MDSLSLSSGGEAAQAGARVGVWRRDDANFDSLTRLGLSEVAVALCARSAGAGSKSGGRVLSDTNSRSRAGCGDWCFRDAGQLSEAAVIWGPERAAGEAIAMGRRVEGSDDGVRGQHGEILPGTAMIG